MYYIVEIPHQLPASAWWVSDPAEFIARVRQTWPGQVMWQQSTVRQEAAAQDVAPDDAAAMSDSGLDALAAQFGLDTPIWYVEPRGANGRWTAEPQDEFETLWACNGEDLYDQHWLSTAEALAVVANEGQEWPPHQRERAVRALRRALYNAGDLASLD